ncbi:MAG TPA: N-acetylornithine carbamoyltransferase [Planctomycetota bacterium]|nr:N-acetylornithine carbamoyltransferase [Planctomycetota bacterium]
MIALKDRHFLSTLDFSVEEVLYLVRRALDLKAEGRGGACPRLLEGRVGALLFFNPSVRTRVSCESAMTRLGGAAITINPGKDTWNFEVGEGVVMDGNTQEHVRELAPVLSRMCHFIGVRKSELITVGSARAEASADYEELARDPFLHALAKYGEVPVVNLESNRFHPLQGLADMATISERIPEPRGKKYVLTWTWHPKSLPVATPHSQMLAAADLGMDVTVLRPNGWELEGEVMEAARERARACGGEVRETDDAEAAFEGAHVVCAKAWGSLNYYGRFDREAQDKAGLRADWTVDEARMDRTADAFFMHCLPVRRNIVVSDGVLDSERSAVIDEAENRLWTAAALFAALGGK